MQQRTPKVNAHFPLNSPPTNHNVSFRAESRDIQLTHEAARNLLLFFHSDDPGLVAICNACAVSLMRNAEL